MDVNDGIVAAAGVAEGFARAGATTHTLLMAGVVVMVAGGFAAAGARYTEERTEWEMNRRLLAAERAAIEADPEAELEELAGIYEPKALSPRSRAGWPRRSPSTIRSPRTPTPSCGSTPSAHPERASTRR